jgi:tetratricopeptide (TPR) repeat protein
MDTVTEKYSKDLQKCFHEMLYLPDKHKGIVMIVKSAIHALGIEMFCNNYELSHLFKEDVPDAVAIKGFCKRWIDKKEEWSIKMISFCYNKTALSILNNSLQDLFLYNYACFTVDELTKLLKTKIAKHNIREPDNAVDCLHTILALLMQKMESTVVTKRKIQTLIQVSQLSSSCITVTVIAHIYAIVGLYMCEEYDEAASMCQSALELISNDTNTVREVTNIFCINSLLYCFPVQWHERFNGIPRGLMIAYLHFLCLVKLSQFEEAEEDVNIIIRICDDMHANWDSCTHLLVMVKTTALQWLLIRHFVDVKKHY